MNRAKGPKWHKKQKDKGIIPKNLRGIDKEATWCKSKADGWVYGHGSFCLTSHKVPFLGRFVWMRNSANEAKRLWLESAPYKGQIDYVAMDSKADDYDLYRRLGLTGFQIDGGLPQPEQKKRAAFSVARR